MGTTRIQALNDQRPRGRRRVLVITYDYPPCRTSAVYRMTGLTKYLVDHGWEPTVLTIRVGCSDQEPKLLEKLPPEVRIERTSYFAVDGWEHKAAEVARAVGVWQPEQAATDKVPSLTSRLLRRAAALFRATVYFPDETAGWVPIALLRALELHFSRRFDAVFTTSPPRAASVVGLLLKKLTGLPWVCELMDPWYPHERPFRRRAERWLHERMMRNADRVVVMMPGHAEELNHNHGVPLEKLSVIRNGFFEEDYERLNDVPANALPDGFFHLSHFGTIYDTNAGLFFPVLEELVREQPELKQRLRIHLTGYPHDRTVLRAFTEGELRDIICFHGYLPDRDAVLRMMRSSDCLLLFWGRPDFSRLAIAGKTYEYLRAGRPILAVTHPGGVQQLVEEGNAGWVVPPDDPAAIKRTLREVLSRPLRNGAPPRPARPEFVAQFRWDCHAAKLAGVLEEVRQP